MCETSCIDCLWNWQDLHGGADRICYNRESRHFHKVCPEKKCRHFSDRVKPGGRSFFGTQTMKKKLKKGRRYVGENRTGDQNSQGS